MNSTLKAAVIGCGMAAKIDHIRWYAAHPDVELVGLADANLDAARFCAQNWGGKPYADVAEMLEVENPHIVSVCSPVSKHCEHAIMVADHGAHVFTEKPMAPTIEECDEMMEAAKRNNVTLGVAFHKRYNVGTEEVRRRIKAGDIGRLYSVERTGLCTPVTSTDFAGRLRLAAGVSRITVPTGWTSIAGGSERSSQFRA